MARIRTIKPEFQQSEQIGRLSREARLTFILLWPFVDDEGRSRAASRMLASVLYPFDDDASTKIDGWLAELEREGLIILYEHEGSSYLQVINWLKHQKIDHPGKSRIPPHSPILANARECSRMLAPDLVPSTVVSRTIGPEAEADASAGESIFGEHLVWLANHSGKSAGSLRSWLGKCCSQYGRPATLTALLELRATSPPPIDPVPYMRRILEGKASLRNGRQKLSPTESTYAGFALALTELDEAEQPRDSRADRDATGALLDAERQPRIAKASGG
ncbi:MAG: hypothetical protein KGJ13_10890 [Patescibacteria group bacterium]|nr:hypothetical protein [Patescibacteria group bacterium]